MPQKGVSNNPSGRPKGIVNKRVQEWEALAQSITENQAAEFNQYLTDLWASEDPKDRMRAAQLFIQVLEYFKPKLNRTSALLEGQDRVTVQIHHLI